MLVEQRLETEHHLGTLRHRGLAPGHKSLLRGGDRLVDFLSGRIGQGGDGVAGRRVWNRVRLLRTRLAEFTADVAVNGLGGDHARAPTGLGSLVGAPWNAARRMNCPAPLRPWNWPSLTRMLPRCITTSGRPRTLMPS